MRNLQEQVKKTFFNKNISDLSLFNQICSSDLKILANSRPSDLNFKILFDPILVTKPFL